MRNDEVPLRLLVHIYPLIPSAIKVASEFLRFPVDGSFKKLLKAASLLLIPASTVSAKTSGDVGTLNPIGHTEVPSVRDQIALRVPPEVSTEAQSV